MSDSSGRSGSTPQTAPPPTASVSSSTALPSTQGASADLENIMRTTVAGKTVTFDVEGFQAVVEAQELEDLSAFEDWVLYTYRNSRGTPTAFVNFAGNREGRSRSSKRENALNPVIAKFLNQYPRMTPLFPPPPNP